jgi:hypothetical protein
VPGGHVFGKTAHHLDRDATSWAASPVFLWGAIAPLVRAQGRAVLVGPSESGMASPRG